jgi:glycosyltransferase involved in cell wall biosynthesis
VGQKAGMDYYDSELMTSLAGKGFETYIFSNFKRKGRINYFTYFSIIQKNKFSKLFNILRGYIKAYRKTRKENIENIILHSFSFSIINFLRIFLALFFARKICLIVHDISSFKKKDNFLFRKFILNRGVSKIIVHNKFSYNELVNYLKPEILDKVSIIKHGSYVKMVDIKRNKNNARKKLNLLIDGKYILFFGQIKKVKGLDILLESMKYIDTTIRLIIAGKPWHDDFQQYEKLIKINRISDRVEKRIRFIPDKERDLLFRSVDSIVVPYRINYQSGVLLMSMSYGLPVIASDIEPFKEIIKNGSNGLLFKSDDPVALSEKINTIFSDHSLKEKIGQNAVKTMMEEYSWDKIAEDYINLINN